MKRIAITFIASVMAAAVLTGCGAASVPTESSDETEVKELPPARAQDDYYRFINQDRFDTAEFEYGDMSVETAFRSKLINDQIKEIIDEVVAGNGYAEGSEEDIIKHAYDYFTAYDFENEPIPEDLMALIEEIDGASTVEELIEVEAKMNRDYGTTGIINIGIDTNYFNPQERITYIYQLDRVLDTTFVDIRDRQYALDDVMDTAKVIMSTRGYDKETSEKIGKKLAYLALDLYGETDLEITEALMGFEYMHEYSAGQVNEMLSNIDLNKYVTILGLDVSKVDSYILNDVDQLKAVNSILVDENLDALKAWELGSLYGNYVRYIAPHYPQLAGMTRKNYDSIHDQALDEILASFVDETDPLYVERYYTPEMDEALRSMCDDIRAGYRKLISGADWLSEPTRKELLQKLENIVYVTGADLKRHDNSKYAGIYGDNYYELCINYNRIKTQKIIASLNEPVSRLDTTMPMQMMNACYQFSLNNITITSAMGLINSNEYFGVGIAVAVIIGCVGAALIIIGVKTSTKRMENYNNNCMNKYNAEVQRRNEMLSNLQQQYNDLENTKADIVGRIQDCLMSNGSNIVIPENYFYSDAIRFFADRIATGRANTLAEAMDAYDEHLHRLRLEQAANEAAEYQRQSASNLAAIQREQAAMRRQGAVNTALHVANTIRHW